MTIRLLNSSGNGARYHKVRIKTKEFRYVANSSLSQDSIQFKALQKLWSPSDEEEEIITQQKYDHY
jgi:hypothetical protein